MFNKFTLYSIVTSWQKVQCLREQYSVHFIIEIMDSIVYSYNILFVQFRTTSNLNDFGIFVVEDLVLSFVFYYYMFFMKEEYIPKLDKEHKSDRNADCMKQ